MTKLEEAIRSHFDNLAGEYDYFKNKNRYYYDRIKELLRKNVPSPEKKSILEVGCGTGTLLAWLNPREGVGIDISPKMIELARSKYPRKNLKYIVSPCESLKLGRKFDVIIMADVIEHLHDVPKAIAALTKVSKRGTLFVMLNPNPRWDFPMWVLELLRQKIPEGPHHFLPTEEVDAILAKDHFHVARTDCDMLLPYHIPRVSDWVNRAFKKVPGLRNYGLILTVVSEYRPTGRK